MIVSMRVSGALGGDEKGMGRLRGLTKGPQGLGGGEETADAGERGKAGNSGWGERRAEKKESDIHSNARSFCRTEKQKMQRAAGIQHTLPGSFVKTVRILLQ